MTSEQRVTSNMSDAEQVNGTGVRQEHSNSSGAEEEIQLPRTKMSGHDALGESGMLITKSAAISRLLEVW